MKEPTNSPGRIHIFVNGILTMPGAVGNWNAHAVTHCICYHNIYAEALEYMALPSITRWLFQGMRANKLRKKLQRYIHQGWDLVLVGHSNGCAVILDALRLLDWPIVRELHFFAPACSEDCRTNGINHALRNDLLGKLHVYVGLKDWALWCADNILGRMLGYGVMGRRGPQFVDDTIPNVSHRVITHVRDDFGHSDWFSEDAFSRTMHMVLE